MLLFRSWLSGMYYFSIMLLGMILHKLSLFWRKGGKYKLHPGYQPQILT